MNERLENQGRLSDLTRKKKSLELSITGLIHTLRAETNPHREIAEMNAELIGEQGLELSQKIDQVKGIETKILALKRALGIE
ncbi:MAG: hypothetical protein KKC20_01065 [Proteobacteria bacterium]|nr:hypothetical protein [Pseudomonadota bacterium]